MATKPQFKRTWEALNSVGLYGGAWLHLGGNPTKNGGAGATNRKSPNHSGQGLQPLPLFQPTFVSHRHPHLLMIIITRMRASSCLLPDVDRIAMMAWIYFGLSALKRANYPKRFCWCREGGSNPHDRKGRRILSPLRLPVPPSRRWKGTVVSIANDAAVEGWRKRLQQLQLGPLSTMRRTPVASRPSALVYSAMAGHFM